MSDDVRTYSSAFDRYVFPSPQPKEMQVDELQRPVESATLVRHFPMLEAAPSRQSR
jgi:hypothetical protein